MDPEERAEWTLLERRFLCYGIAPNPGDGE